MHGMNILIDIDLKWIRAMALVTHLLIVTEKLIAGVKQGRVSTIYYLPAWSIAEGKADDLRHEDMSDFRADSRLESNINPYTPSLDLLYIKNGIK